MFIAAKETLPRLPVWHTDASSSRTLRSHSTRTEGIGAQRNGLHSGHIMIGLIQHAAAQPDATPETGALAQRLTQRHLKPVARDV